jgi:hypothetical protein
MIQADTGGLRQSSTRDPWQWGHTGDEMEDNSPRLMGHLVPHLGRKPGWAASFPMTTDGLERSKIVFCCSQLLAGILPDLLVICRGVEQGVATDIPINPCGKLAAET